MAKRHPNIESIFSDAIELSSEQERIELLDKACDGDVELRSKVEGLIQAHLAAEEGFLEKPAAKIDGDVLGQLDAPTIDKHGSGSTNLPSGLSQIGPYKILQEIAEGGMGSVWMAQQEKPVRRRVALKIIKRGKADKQLIARFEAERQALAMMDHPNIAKVLDAGQADDGSPYLVMELVQGIPITKYCDQNKLTPVERLKLFVPVCKAIQHAHQKGILHRDLKPANVLVCIQDGKPVPKVIDFGLAKPLQHQVKLTDKTMFTEFGQVMGTVQYMSPEQAVLDALDVDSRSDIYSLGIMLYELLSGSTPVDQETLKQNALLKVLDIIREQDPPRPSARLSASRDRLSEIGEQRQIQPSKLEQILRNELDWVVMKALEKDRTRRYESANDFAADIERYLNGEAVVARPPTLLYRTSKYVRKHKAFFATAMTVAALLIIAFSVIGWQKMEAARLSVVERLESTFDSLETGRGPAIPIILEQLDSLPEDLVVEKLEEDFASATGQEKLNLAYGLAHFDQVEVNTILDGLLLAETEPEEIDNILTALRRDEANSLGGIKSRAQKATSDKNWISKSRLAIVALHLGETSLAAEMLRDQPDPSRFNLDLPDHLSRYQKTVDQLTAMPDKLRTTAKYRSMLAEAYYYLGEYDKALLELDQLAQGNSTSWPGNESARQAKKTLIDYDIGRDGVLDDFESDKVSKLPWGADKNADGFITFDELADGNVDGPSTPAIGDIVSYSKSILELYDQNGDGVLDAGEASGIRCLPWGTDENADGKLNWGELVVGFGGRTSSSRIENVNAYAKTILQNYDSNHDRVLNGIESESLPPFPENVSQNADGNITLTELVEGFGGSYRARRRTDTYSTNSEFDNIVLDAFLVLDMYDQNGDGVLDHSESVCLHFLFPTANIDVERDINGYELIAAIGPSYPTNVIDDLVSDAMLVLQMFDKNGDEFLDKIESARFRWLPAKADLNADGKLNLHELMVDFGRRSSSARIEIIVSGLKDIFLTDYDQNGDGVLGADESKNIRSLPAGADKYLDGNITWDELIAAYTRMSSLSYVMQILKVFDQDGDGGLSSDEKKHIRWLRSRIASRIPSDRNQDGKLTLDEVGVHALGTSTSDIAKSVLRTFDKNSDRVLDGEELQSVGELPSDVDKDKDETITEKELVIWLDGCVPFKSDDDIFFRSKAVLQSCDQNGDGVLDKAESKNLRWLPVGTDRNADGKITWEELVIGYRSRLSRSGLDKRFSKAKSVLTKYDQDGDGVLNKAELNVPEPLSAEIDRNRDGKITQVEFDAYFRARQRKLATPTSRQEQIRSNASRLFKKYDKDSSRVLEQSEWMKARAIPKTADKDEDGKITLDELIIEFGGDPKLAAVKPASPTRAKGNDAESAFARYNQDGNRYLEKSEWTSTGVWNELRGVDKNEDGFVTWDELVLGMEDDAGSRARSLSSSSRSTFSRRSSTSSSSSSSSASSSPSSSTSNDKYVSNAQSLLKKFDKNEDGLLSRKELSAMFRPPKGADVNGDGYVNLNELVVAVGGTGLNAPWASFSPRDCIVTYAMLAMAKSDKNGDGSLDRAESKNLGQLPLGADNNADGQLTLEELITAYDNPLSSSAIRKVVFTATSILRRCDKNGDEVLDETEWHRLRGLSRITDRNGDGKITLVELVRANGSAYPLTARLDKLIASAKPILKMHDKNQDGALDVDEMMGLEGLPWATDANADVQITWDELIVAYGDSLKSSIDEVVYYAMSTLEMYDKNSDGVLDATESERLRWVAPGTDRDADGKITWDELILLLGEGDSFTQIDDIVSSADLVLKKYDENGDRLLNATEAKKLQWLPTKADKNGDRRISRNELIIVFCPEPFFSFAEPAFNGCDQNGDGVLSLEEWKGLRWLPDGTDQNVDGNITLTELAIGYRGRLTPSHFETNVAFVKAVLDGYDQNGDSVLDSAELKSFQWLSPRQLGNRKRRMSWYQLITEYGGHTPSSRFASWILSKSGRRDDGFLPSTESNKLGTLPSGADKDHDGKVSWDELALGYRGRLSSLSSDKIVSYTRKVLDMHDRNGDGVLNATESESLQGLLWAKDSDADGEITWDELAIEYQAHSLSFHSLVERVDSDASLILEKCDKNGDAILDRTELKIFAFRRNTDKDRNGKITLKELRRFISGLGSSDIGSVVTYTTTIFELCDQNDDGVLNEEESKSIRGLPSGTDHNGDGKITWDELSIGIYGQFHHSGVDQIIARAWLIIEEHDENGNGELEENESAGVLSLPFRVHKNRDGTITLRNLVVSSSSSSSSFSSRSSRNDKIVKYAQSILSKYDKNNDNRLDSDESKNIRSLPAGADGNQSGTVTLDELVLAYGGPHGIRFRPKPVASPLSLSSRNEGFVVMLHAVCQARANLDEKAHDSLESYSEIESRFRSIVSCCEILVKAGLGKLDAAEEQLVQLLVESPNDGFVQFHSALIAAQLMRACHERQLPQADRFRDLSLRLLRKACLQLGYFSDIESHPDLIPLRQDPEFLELAAEIQPNLVAFDPIQRTVFIREFALWSGPIASLAESVVDSEDHALRSGISLAIGGIKKPGQEAENKWQPILSQWYLDANDSGTHSASWWALSQWKLETPRVAATRNPLSERDWWHEPSGLRLVRINAGQVAGEQGLIKVQNDFWLSDSEVTVGLFHQFKSDVEYHAKFPELMPDWGGPIIAKKLDAPNLPVENVSWYEAVLFCNWLSYKLDLEPCYEVTKNGQNYEVNWVRGGGNGIRLPTNDEWEYACRGGATTRYSFGDDEQDLVDYGWFYLNCDSPTRSIRGKACNAWGLFDMHGNVSEWSGLNTSANRTSQGGNRRSDAKSCESSNRSQIPASDRSRNLGFRVARKQP